MFSIKTSVMESTIIISDYADQAPVQNPDAVPDLSIVLASVELEQNNLLNVIILQIDSN